MNNTQRESAGTALRAWFQNLGGRKADSSLLVGVHRNESAEATAGAVTVNATWAPGVFPEGTTLHVEDAGKDKALSMAGAAGLDAVDGEAVDITFIYNNDPIQPAAGKSVSISLSLSRSLEGTSFTVLHEKAAAPQRRMLMKGAASGDSTNVETVAVGASANSASFAGSSFSVYAVVGTEALNRVKVNFQGVPGATQIVKAGDTLSKPDPDPVDPNGTGEFTGWKLGTTAIGDAYFGAALTDEQITALANGQEFNDGNHHLVEITLTPAFSSSLTVRFWTTSEKTQRTDTRVVNSGEELSLSGINYVAPAGKALTGWTDGTGSYSDKIASVTADMDLWPVLEEGHWVYFHSNGGNAVNPHFVEDGEKTSAPDPAPQKQGYILSGWYDNEGLTGDPFNFTTPITAEKHLYAKWSPDTVEYLVLLWLQNVTGNDHDKDYTLGGYISKSGLVGSDVSFTDEDRNNSDLTEAMSEFYNGSHYKVCQYEDEINDAQVDAVNAAGGIAANGGTILNVYAKRKTATIIFQDSGGNVISSTKMRNRETIYFEQSDPTSTVYLWHNRYITTAAGGQNMLEHGGYSQYPVDIAAYTYSYGGPEWPDGWKVVFKQSWRYMPYPERREWYIQNLDNPDPSDLDGYTLYDYLNMRAHIPSGGCIFTEELFDGGFTINHDHTQGSIQWTNPNDSRGFYYYIDYCRKENGQWVAIPIQAYYERNRFSLGFRPEDGTTTLDQSILYEDAVNQYVPSGYVVDQTECNIGGVPHIFKGWYDNAEYIGNPADFSTLTMPAHALVFYAKWEPKTATVTFDPNYEGAAAIPDQVRPYGDHVVDPDITRDGYTLLGWFDEDGELWNFAEGLVNGDIHLTARWAAPGVTYTVKYMPDDDPTDAAIYADGSEIALKGAPSSIPSGYRFIGWTLTETEVPAARRTRSNPTPITGTITANAENAAVVVIPGKEYQIGLYPLFASESQPQATLIYHANYPDGTDPTYESSETPVNGELTVLALAATGFTAPTGYEFIGWNTAAGGGGDDYAAGDPCAVESTGNVLYAQWKLKTIEITVTKVWSDNNSSKRPDSVDITLSGSDGSSMTVTLNGERDEPPSGSDPAGYESGEWIAKFVNLPEYKDGEKIVYTVSEDQVPGYQKPVITGSAASGFTVTNRLRTSNSPFTGDNRAWLPWLGLLVLSGAALGVDAIVRGRKKRKERD